MDDVLKQLLDDFLAKNANARAKVEAQNAARAAAVTADAEAAQATTDKESSRQALLQAITGA